MNYTSPACRAARKDPVESCSLKVLDPISVQQAILVRLSIILSEVQTLETVCCSIYWVLTWLLTCTSVSFCLSVCLSFFLPFFPYFFLFCLLFCISASVGFVLSKHLIRTNSCSLVLPEFSISGCCLCAHFNPAISAEISQR